MKKRLVVLLSIIMLLGGCGLSNEQYKDACKEPEEQTKIEEDSAAEDNALSMIPEWILPYTETGQLSDSIYLNRENISFSFNDNNISFPESTIIIAVKELAGRDREAIQGKREDMIDFINHIEDSEILSETETINPDAHLLGIDFSVILLTADNEYVLINFSIFDDDRICIDAISEKPENNICIWMKSSEVVKKMKDLAEYKELNSIPLDSIERIELSNDMGDSCQFTGSETEQMENILKRANIKSADFKCPYDIKLTFYVNGEKVHAKFCNDSCRILAVEGFYLELEEQDANWILGIIENLNNNM